MKNLKDFLIGLKERFGSCDRKAFLKKLRDRFSSSAGKPELVEYAKKPEDKQPEVEERIIDINGTDAWQNHVNCIKDVSILSSFMSRSKTLLNSKNIADFAKFVNTSLTNIPIYVDKHIKEPRDINDDTSEEVAEQTGKLVKEYILDLFRGCYDGMKHSQGEEKKFYEDFYDCLEKYLSSIGVYRKNITVGMDVRTNAKWFEMPVILESSTTDPVGTIAEIRVNPHRIFYCNDFGNREEFILKGECLVFGEAKNK